MDKSFYVVYSMEVKYDVTKDFNSGKNTARITIPPTPPNTKNASITISEEQYYEFKGPDGNEIFSRIKEINDEKITAYVAGNVVILYKNIKNTGGRKSRKTRKNKSRRYRRV